MPARRVRRSPARRDERFLIAWFGARGTLQLPRPAPPEAGDSVVVAFAASDGTNRDAVETRLPVRPDFSPRTHAALAVRDSADVVMALPAEIDPARSRMRLRIGTSPLSTMLAAYRWLRAYRIRLHRADLERWPFDDRGLAGHEDKSNALGGDPRPSFRSSSMRSLRGKASTGASGTGTTSGGARPG